MNTRIDIYPLGSKFKCGWCTNTVTYLGIMVVFRKIDTRKDWRNKNCRRKLKWKRRKTQENTWINEKQTHKNYLCTHRNSIFIGFFWCVFSLVCLNADSFIFIAFVCSILIFMFCFALYYFGMSSMFGLGRTELKYW